MTRFRRPRVSRFRRRRGGTIYEMQQVSFTHESVVVPPALAPVISQDLFLLAHPRLEWSITGPTTADNFALPIAKGVVIDGLRQALRLAYIPQFVSSGGTATAGGVVTIHAALVSIPTDETLTPLAVPSTSTGGFLYTEDDQPSSATASVSRGKWRILWRGMYQLAVVDGTLNATAGVQSAQDQLSFAVFTGGGFGSGADREFVRVKSKLRLGMDQGLFLVIECRTPFIAGANVVLGVDYWAVLPVKSLTRGSSYR